MSEEIESNAKSLMRKSFLNEIQPLIKKKSNIISRVISPFSLVMNKGTGKLERSDGKYPAEIQAKLDEIDRTIQNIRFIHSTEEVKAEFMREAKMIIDRIDRKNNHPLAHIEQEVMSE